MDRRVHKAHAVVPEAQVGAAVVAQAVGYPAKCAFVPLEQRDQCARRGIVDQIVLSHTPAVEGAVELAVRLRVGGEQIAGQQASAIADLPPATGRAGAQQLLVDVVPVVEPVEDALHEAPAVEVIVEVVRARLRSKELERLQDAGRGQRIISHALCLPALRGLVKE